MLIEKGVDVNFGARAQLCSSALKSSVFYGNYNTAKFLINHGARVDKDALATAGSVAMMELLISHAEEDAIYQCGALHAACRGGTSAMDLILFLLDRKFDINDSDKWGNTPLLSVCRSDRPCPEIVQFLLSNGADVSAQSTKKYGGHGIEGDTPCESFPLNRCGSSDPVHR